MRDRIVRTPRLALLSFALLAPLSLVAEPPALAVVDPPERAMVLTSRLVLPYYEVDKNDPLGDTVLYAVRNESTQPAQVKVEYFEVDSPFAPQRTDTVALAAKQVYPINLRDVANLEIDGDGKARGYVIFSVVGGATVLAGDYFRVDPGDNFASGMRLVNADIASVHDERCGIFSVRFLRGGAFTGSTRLFYWLDTNTLPENPLTISYAIYDQAGNSLRLGNLPTTNRVAGTFLIDQLLDGVTVPDNAGVLELQISGMKGHLAASMNASGKFSVGLEATCRE